MWAVKLCRNSPSLCYMFLNSKYEFEFYFALRHHHHDGDYTVFRRYRDKQVVWLWLVSNFSIFSFQFKLLARPIPPDLKGSVRCLFSASDLLQTLDFPEHLIDWWTNILVLDSSSPEFSFLYIQGNYIESSEKTEVSYLENPSQVEAY